MDNGNDSGRGGSVAAILGAIVLVLGLLTVWGSGTNRDLQQRAAANQQKLAKAQAVANLDNNLVQLLAKAAVEGKDDALRDLLLVNGVTFKQGAVPPPQVAAPPVQAPANGN